MRPAYVLVGERLNQYLCFLSMPGTSRCTLRFYLGGKYPHFAPCTPDFLLSSSYATYKYNMFFYLFFSRFHLTSQTGDCIAATRSILKDHAPQFLLLVLFQHSCVHLFSCSTLCFFVFEKKKKNSAVSIFFFFRPLT